MCINFLKIPPNERMVEPDDLRLGVDVGPTHLQLSSPA